MMRKLQGEPAKNRRDDNRQASDPAALPEVSARRAGVFLNADFSIESLWQVVFESEKDAKRDGTLPNPG